MRLILFVFAVVSSAFGQSLFVTVGPTQYRANGVVGALAATVTGTLVDGGIGDVPATAWRDRVVLVRRGAVTYLTKVRNAEASGALAVVVANNNSTSPDTGTLGTGNTSTIPVVMVSQSDGNALANFMGAEARVGIALPVQPEPKIPDPVGRAGEFIYSDGTKYVLSANAKPNPTVTISLEVAVGKQAAFTVSAWGPTPYSFQWSKDGVNIAGATSAALVFPAAKLADAGQYVCLVSNAFGATASRVAVLSVK